MVRLLGVVACALACGGPQQVPVQRAPEVKTYGPLGIRADAKSPHQAVILGTDTNNGSTVIPLPASSGKTLVDAMFVKLAQPITGGLSPVKLTTAPNTDG